MNPDSPLIIIPAYKDARGLNHYLAACMICGTIHDVVPSFKAIIGSPWRICGYITASSIVKEYNKSGLNIGIDEYASKHINLPYDIIEPLIEHGHLKSSAVVHKADSGYDLDRPHNAIEAYRQATLINPEDATAWNNLGYAYDELKHTQDAIEAYQKSLTIYPEDSGIWNRLGVCHYNLQHYKEAVDSLRQSLEINPDNASVWSNLGIAYRTLKRYEEAIEAYRQAIRIDQEYAKAWYGLGLVYHYSGNTEAAMDIIKELRRRDPVRADKLSNVIEPR